MSAEVQLTAGNFDQEVMNSAIPVLVDFWASWCGPCKMIMPFIEQLAAEYQGKVKIGKVNVDEENQLAQRYNVVSIPTLIVFKDGTVVNQKTGAAPKREIEAMFSNLI